MTLKKIVQFFLLMFFISSPVFAGDGHEPFFKTDNIECSAWGYANIVGGPDKDFMASAIRLRTTCNYKNFTVFMENDIAGLDHRVTENYITQAWISYNFGREGLAGNLFTNTVIRAGALVTAARLYLPGANETIPVEGPANPFRPYGYGVQIQTKITPELLFVGDVTGSTTPSFDDKERWNGIETSQRLVWDAVREAETGKIQLQLSLFHQWSDNAERIGFGAKYSPIEDLNLYGGIYHTNEKMKGQTLGEYALVDYKLWSMENNALELRTMGMIEMMNGAKEYTGFTGGLSLVLPKDGGYGRLGGSSVTVDFTHSTMEMNNKPKITDNAFMTRIRIFF